MSEHHYKFNVKMTCGGCSGAVERVLKKLDGLLNPISSPVYTASLPPPFHLSVSALANILLVAQA
jgi:copper chaperone CopZ